MEIQLSNTFKLYVTTLANHGSNIKLKSLLKFDNNPIANKNFPVFVLIQQKTPKTIERYTIETLERMLYN